MMLELNNYYIQELENLTDLFTNIFVIIDDNNDSLFIRYFLFYLTSIY